MGVAFVDCFADDFLADFIEVAPFKILLRQNILETN
jgi:hypothetical protein